MNIDLNKFTHEDMNIDSYEFNDETTLNEVIDIAVAIKSGGQAKSTKEGYQKKANQVKGWIGDRKVSEFGYTQWAIFLAKLLERYKPKSITNFMDILNPTFDLLIANDYLASNPFENKKLPRPVKQVPNVFTVGKIRSLTVMNADLESEILLLRLGVLTGLRVGELLAINAEGYKKERGVYCVEITFSTDNFRTPKNERSKREVDLCSNAINTFDRLIVLAQVRGASCITVTHSDNKTIEIQSRTLLAYNSKRKELYKQVSHYATDFLKMHCASTGVDYLPPSNLRHTYASQLLTKGVPLAWVAKQMGHTTEEMIENHYGVWIKEDGIETTVKVDEHFDTYFDNNIEAANDEVFIKQDNLKISWFKNLLTKLFTKAA